MRAVATLAALSTRHEVTLLAPEPGPGQPPPPAHLPCRLATYRRRGISAWRGVGKALWGGLPLQSGLFYEPDLGRRLRELRGEADLGFLQLVRLAVHLDDLSGLPLLVDLIDSLSLSFLKRAEVDRPWMRPLLRFEARRLAVWERRLIERAEKTLVVAERDRQALLENLPPSLSGKVAVVPLGVEPVSPPALPALARSGSAAPLLALTGNLGYFVTVDAVTWWLSEVWPRLRQALPEVRVVVAGDRPARAVRRAVERAGPRVELAASPPDLRALLAEATLSLAPLRCGAGVPVKVLEAWAVGVPVVASAWAAAGTSGRPGEDLRVVGDSPAEWVEAVVELLADPDERQRLRENGHRRLAADYSPAAVERQLASLL
ncbi:MAG TPA: glycosyltransferase family 4 protein [Thermoanaerobaculia bacterium]|nr:glycosyltransferase family 4 protein [Thermoanaerobaculia bacterium]